MTKPGSWAQPWPQFTSRSSLPGVLLGPVRQSSSGVHIFSGTSLPFQATCWDPKGCFSQQLTQLLLTWPSSLTSRCPGCPPSGLRPSSSATFFLGHNKRPKQVAQVLRAPLPARSCLRPHINPGRSVWIPLFSEPQFPHQGGKGGLRGSACGEPSFLPPRIAAPGYTSFFL